MAQLRCVLTQLEKHKVHDDHASSRNCPVVHVAQLRRVLTHLEKHRVRCAASFR